MMICMVHAFFKDCVFSKTYYVQNSELKISRFLNNLSQVIEILAHSNPKVSEIVEIDNGAIKTLFCVRNMSNKDCYLPPILIKRT